jgi:hypothetical protein
MFYLVYKAIDDMKMLTQIFLVLLVGSQGALRIPCHFFDKQFEQPRNSKNLKIQLEKSLKLTWKGVKFVLIFNAISVNLPVLICAFIFFVFGNMEASYPLNLPGTDIKTRSGFFMNFPFHLFMGVFTACCYSSTDCSNVFVTMQTKAFVEVFKGSLDELEVEASKPIKDVNKIKQMMKNVVENHHSILSYKNLLAKRLNKISFIVVFVNTYLVCFGLVSMLYNKTYFSASGVVCLALCQLFLICSIGTFINHQHERLLEALWNFKWYELPKEEQKSFLIILMNAQTSLSLKQLFVGEVNMQLFIEVSL